MASDFLKPLPIFCSQSQSQQSSRCRLTSLLSTTSLSQKPSTPPEPRHYRIFADYSTDFIWRDFNDLRFGEGDCVLEAEEVLSSFPPSVLQLYDAWVDTYNENFRERREKSQTYRATTFESVSEEVAWNVAGFLLAWRIAMAPQVGRIEFSAGCSKYLIEREEKRRVTLWNFCRTRLIFWLKESLWHRAMNTSKVDFYPWVLRIAYVFLYRGSIPPSDLLGLNLELNVFNRPKAECW